MTICDISTVLKEALPHATTPANDQNGFVVTATPVIHPIQSTLYRPPSKACLLAVNMDVVSLSHHCELLLGDQSLPGTTVWERTYSSPVDKHSAPLPL
ncbi:hypothetical protein JTB14_037146 [Gonioctena quinquepunctata]|nr:hypothetical protein JTB14_037146 [Gonioctena quinquepunctata]